MRNRGVLILILLVARCIFPEGAKGESFVAPYSGNLYVQCVGGSAGAISQFGLGTSPANFVPYLSGLPASTPEVFVATVSAGQTVQFGVYTLNSSIRYWAFSSLSSTDQASLVAFTDVNNRLGMAGKIIQQTGPTTWVMHLNDAAHYTLDSSEANNILIQLQLDGSATVQHGESFVAPYSGNLYLKAVGGAGRAYWKFGIGTPGKCVGFLSGPYSGGIGPPFYPLDNSAEVFVESVNASQTVLFCMSSSGSDPSVSNGVWAFSNATDRASVVAFWDTNNSLKMGGKIIQQTGPTTWVMHLDDTTHLNVDSNSDVLVQVRLEAAPGSPFSFKVPPSGRLYAQAVGGGAGGVSFGLGTNPTNFVGFLSADSRDEVLLGPFNAGESVPFGMQTGQTAWAFSSGTDRASVVAFTDVDKSLGFGGSVVEQTSSTSWLLHLHNPASYPADKTYILIKLRLEAAPVEPIFSSSAIVNAASFAPGLVPGGLVSLFGTGLSKGITGTVFPGGSTSYQGISVSIGGGQNHPGPARLAPLLSITNQSGQEQINLQVPFEVAPGTTTVQIQNNGAQLTVEDVPVFAAKPGIFEIPLAPGGPMVAAAIHLDGQLVTPSNPAQRGEILSLFLTGAGAVQPSVPTGAIGPLPPATTALPVAVGVAGVGVPVLFSGYAPGFIGLYQINFQVPTGAPSGPNLSLDVKVGSANGKTSSIAVQ